LKVVWITTSDSVENAYLFQSDVILQIQVRWTTCLAGVDYSNDNIIIAQHGNDEGVIDCWPGIEDYSSLDTEPRLVSK
jgi:hypothetical protein